MVQEQLAGIILTELKELKIILVKNHIDKFTGEIVALENEVGTYSNLNDAMQANIELFNLIEKIYRLTEKIDIHKEAIFNEIASLKKHYQATTFYTQGNQ